MGIGGDDSMILFCSRQLKEAMNGALLVPVGDQKLRTKSTKRLIDLSGSKRLQQVQDHNYNLGGGMNKTRLGRVTSSYSTCLKGGSMFVFNDHAKRFRLFGSCAVSSFSVIGN
mmetsp:Transcript_12561/g.34613  ORF Transcript_12561/g.34613 Transcript_12561/m.34613 type:complete len:113 (-) Transcript_12561:1294-1632(-)